MHKSPRRQPARLCVICGTSFEPYRAAFTTCSRRCYAQLPEQKAAAAARQARPEARERKNATRRLANNPARHAVNRTQGLRRYGLTIEEYDRLVAEQDGRCYLCGHIPNGGWRPTARLTIDHDHTTGAVRRLLCNGCNRGLGYLKDDPDLMERAAAYVRSYR